MNTVKRRLTCIILALFVALSGIGFDTVATGNEYVNKADTDNNSVISVDECMVDDVQVCTSETLGMRGNAGVRQIYTRADCNKRDVNHYHGVTCIDISSLCDIKTNNCSDVVVCCDDFRREIVTEYIHRSDGKKRI